MKKVLCGILAVCMLGGLLVFGTSFYVKRVTEDQILTSAEAANIPDVDCILVLGCRVQEDGTPSLMLRDRLETGVELYKLGASDRILMSGDHKSDGYNEVSAMKNYGVQAGIPSEAVFIDAAGLSTYDSIYRVQNQFGAKKVLIVTQNYHLYRALYIADKLGLTAYGVASAGENYPGQSLRDFREVLARNKDVLKVLSGASSEILGPIFDLSGSGDDPNLLGPSEYWD